MSATRRKPEVRVVHVPTVDVIPAGALFTITYAPEFSGRIDGIFRALQDIRLEDLIERWRSDISMYADMEVFEPRAFLRWCAWQRLFEELPTYDLLVGHMVDHERVWASRHEADVGVKTTDEEAQEWETAMDQKKQYDEACAEQDRNRDQSGH